MNIANNRIVVSSSRELYRNLGAEDTLTNISHRGQIHFFFGEVLKNPGVVR
jgi:hypothetical protein